jgi:hypothetical protein
MHVVRHCLRASDEPVLRAEKFARTTEACIVEKTRWEDVEMQALKVESLRQKRGVSSQSGSGAPINYNWGDQQLVDRAGVKLGLLTANTFSIFPNAPDSEEATMVFSLKITAQGYETIRPFNPVLQVYDAAGVIIESWTLAPFYIGCPNNAVPYTVKTVVARAVYDNLDSVGWITLGYPPDNTVPMRHCG